MPDWLRLILVLIIACGLSIAIGVVLMTRVLLRPPRMTDGKAAWVLKRLSPGDLSLPFEPMEFSVRDEPSGRPLRLAAWWIGQPVAGGRCIVLLHGYADAKVGAIAWAPLFHSLGWNILALDLRAHGESDGALITAGHLERDDVTQVIDQLRAMRPEQTRRMALFGASFGGAVACATAASREDIEAVILDSPMANFEEAAMRHCDTLGFPGRLLQRLALRYARWLTGADFAALTPAALLPTIRSHVMLIESEADPHNPAAARKGWDEAMASREALPYLSARWTTSAPHLLGLSTDPDGYRQRVGGVSGGD